ncbi:hypothetical protein BC827DRAFT_1156808 [Russula dissimulans]|nr:hypothetical protein BC827DRAFT_1156808 [Russula dissimulans]
MGDGHSHWEGLVNIGLICRSSRTIPQAASPSQGLSSTTTSGTTTTNANTINTGIISSVALVTHNSMLPARPCSSSNCPVGQKGQYHVSMATSWPSMSSGRAGAAHASVPAPALAVIVPDESGPRTGMTIPPARRSRRSLWLVVHPRGVVQAKRCTRCQQSLETGIQRLPVQKTVKAGFAVRWAGREATRRPWPLPNPNNYWVTRDTGIRARVPKASWVLRWFLSRDVTEMNKQQWRMKRRGLKLKCRNVYCFFGALISGPINLVDTSESDTSVETLRREMWGLTLDKLLVTRAARAYRVIGAAEWGDRDHFQVRRFWFQSSTLSNGDARDDCDGASTYADADAERPELLFCVHASAVDVDPGSWRWSWWGSRFCHRMRLRVRLWLQVQVLAQEAEMGWRRLELAEAGLSASYVGGHLLLPLPLSSSIQTLQEICAQLLRQVSLARRPRQTARLSARTGHPTVRCGKAHAQLGDHVLQDRCERGDAADVAALEDAKPMWLWIVCCLSVRHRSLSLRLSFALPSGDDALPESVDTA